VAFAADEVRARALDAFLAQREADGYRIEARSPVQAVICRRHRLHLVLRFVTRGSGERRLLISVDQHGVVTSVVAEPARW
jgi:riboflavin biosynthesis pyrimidine reductase